MSNPKQLSNQARDNKAHKPSGQKQPPASQKVENQTHPLSPNLLQQALENPQAARPEILLQLQRQYGNQVVSQLLAQRGANGARLTHTHQQTNHIQRTIDFKFTTDVGLIAGATKPHDKMFQPIIKTFKEYKEASKKGKINEEYRLLKELKNLCTNWLDTYGGKYPNKTTDLKMLLPKVNEELTNPKFANEIKVNDALLETIMDTFREYREANKKKWISAEYELLKELKQLCQKWITEDTSPPGTPKLSQVMHILAQAIAGLEDSKFADHMKSDRQIEKIKAYEYKINPHNKDSLAVLRRNKKPWLTLPLEEQEELKNRYKEKVATLEKANLTRAERAAIASYTDANFAFINPAMSDNEAWLKANIESDKTLEFRQTKLDTSPQGIKKAIVENKKIAKLAQAGLNKLPNWQQDKRLYRGDTFSIKEGEKLRPGETKTYPHFVSTSLETNVPKSFAAGKRSPERPIGIVWHITHSKNGKNIADLSAVQSELEILFPANTTFHIDKVLDRKLDEKGMIEEVEAHEV